MNGRTSLTLSWFLCLLTTISTAGAAPFIQDTSVKQKPADKAPFKYVPAKAFYILPETHNNQSGYFSLSEGLDGNMHIGTAAYGDNAYLVEFDPATEMQRIAIDTNKVCGLSAKGYAAQAKIHTRNFVGPSGVVYVGSKQGYRLDKNDKSEYPGGYVMSYDPRNGRTKNLGMPFKGQGIADVMVDEKRGLTYIVTCEDQHWMLGSTEGGRYRELGPRLTPYAMTLIAADGKAYAITKDFQLASYDPDSDQIKTRPILLDGKPWTRENNHSIPTWVLTLDRKNVYLLLLNDSRLIEFELVGDKPKVVAKSHGKMLDGKRPDSRCGLDLGADGNVYAVIRINNDTGFGKGFLHHLVRFVPKTRKMEDLGVLKVSNPDFFDFDKKDKHGKPQKWIHGFHTLPDKTLTPLHAHMSLKVCSDNTIYVTIIYPFTLLKIDAFKLKSTAPSPAENYLNWAEKATIDAEKNIAQFTTVAELIAVRHIKGGLIGFPFVQQAVAQDLWGRSGGLVHIGFGRSWKEKRSDAEQANDVAIVGYDQAPAPNDLKKLQALKKRGVYIVGFGPKKDKRLAKIIGVCDAWFDSGLSKTGHVVKTSKGKMAGRGNVAVNAIHGGTLIAEIVGALTRKGKMPTIWKGYAYDDGRQWGEKYFRKKQFHDDYKIEPLKPGELGKRFLTQIRYPIRRIRRQSLSLKNAAQHIKAEISKQKQSMSLGKATCRQPILVKETIIVGPKRLSFIRFSNHKSKQIAKMFPIVRLC